MQFECRGVGNAVDCGSLSESVGRDDERKHEKDPVIEEGAIGRKEGKLGDFALSMGIGDVMPVYAVFISEKDIKSFVFVSTAP